MRMTTTSARWRLLLLLALIIASSTVVVVVDARVGQEDSSIEDINDIIDRNLQSNLDGRWKSTKLSQKQKAELGLFPPPGEVWPDDPPELLEAAEEAAADAGDGSVSVVDTVEEEHAVEEVLEIQDDDDYTPVDAAEAAVDAPEDPPQKKEGNRRKFVSYTPSKFESTWVKNVPKLVSMHLICRRLVDGKHQTQMMHKLLEFMCTAPLEGTDWCYWHDHNHFVWYNKGDTSKFELYIDTTPEDLIGVTPPPVSPTPRSDTSEWDWIASKFTFLDETTGEEYHEYIEPLVGHLRFPLAGCLEDQPLLTEFASFVMPPPTLERVDGRAIMLDVGSRDWSRMEYIVEEWEARNAGFAYLLSYCTDLDEVDDEFLKTVPEHHKSKIFRQYFKLAEQPTTDDAEVYIPSEIALDSHPDDYVMLKLDHHTHATLKKSILQAIQTTDVHVDEIFWEVNAKDNYLFEHYFDTNLKFAEVSDMTLKEAYTILQGLRFKGIRAHAWI